MNLESRSQYKARTRDQTTRRRTRSDVRHMETKTTTKRRHARDAVFLPFAPTAGGPHPYLRELIAPRRGKDEEDRIEAEMRGAQREEETLSVAMSRLRDE